MLTIDLSENEVLGPAFLKGREQGREEGREEGEMKLLRFLLEQRFGPLSPEHSEKLSRFDSQKVEAAATRFYNGAGLDQIFK